MAGDRFRQRLRQLAQPQADALILDGALGTELTRRGYSMRLPAWSAPAVWEAPELLAGVHREMAAAGAEVLTANTFRGHARNLRGTRFANRSPEFVARAVAIARSAAGPERFVVGSQAPLEDCYLPELTPAPADLAAEHAAMAQALAAAGVDGILVETMGTRDEAQAAARAASATGLPTLLSVLCREAGRLWSGEPLAELLAALEGVPLEAVMLNCLAAPDAAAALTALLAERNPAAERPLAGVYANTGRFDQRAGCWRDTDAVDPARYAEYAVTWRGQGARIIGGCCGTTPAHLAAVHARLNADRRT